MNEPNQKLVVKDNMLSSSVPTNSQNTEISTISCIKKNHQGSCYVNDKQPVTTRDRTGTYSHLSDPNGHNISSTSPITSAEMKPSIINNKLKDPKRRVRFRLLVDDSLPLCSDSAKHDLNTGLDYNNLDITSNLQTENWNITPNCFRRLEDSDIKLSSSDQNMVLDEPITYREKRLLNLVFGKKTCTSLSSNNIMYIFRYWFITIISIILFLILTYPAYGKKLISLNTTYDPYLTFRIQFLIFIISMILLTFIINSWIKTHPPCKY